MRKDVLAGAAVGAALIGGAALYYFREKSTEEPDFRPLETDGDHQIRGYPALTVAETVVEGSRRAALDKGYRILADYLAAARAKVTNSNSASRSCKTAATRWLAIRPCSTMIWKAPPGARGS